MRADRQGKLDARPRKWHGRLRWTVRGACLLVAVILLWPATGSANWSAIVPALSPWVTLSSLVATWTIHAMAWLGSAVFLICLLSHRFVCRWVCPMGLCAEAASRMSRRRCPQVAPLGQWIAWVTLGGACLGYPLLLWLDPLAMFSGLFRIGQPEPTLATVLAAMGLPAVILLSLWWPFVWCGRFCPLGAFQDLLSKVRLMRAALSRTQSSRELRQWGPTLARRAVLGAGVGVVWTLAARRARASASRPLRPPGAIGEPEFLGTCVRCGNCLRACPTRIIASDLGDHGLASLLTPVLSFRNDYCREDCARCTDVCPSGALERLPLAAKPQMRIGWPRVDMNLCLLGDNRECAACRSHCPYEAVRYVWSESEYTLTPQIDPEACTGCGACEVACPTMPEKAIVVVPAD